MACAEGRAQRNLSRQADARAYLGKGPRLAKTGELQNVQAGTLTRQLRSPTDGAHNHIGKCDGGVEIALWRDLETCYANGRFSDARGILPTGDVERGQPVGKVTLNADGSA